MIGEQLPVNFSTNHIVLFVS